ncbi:methyltransferase domain-containing protein [Sphingomonas gei]|uniref:Methyltransferase domain-containing protein n=1 Tax=Sphingomonas gei TaxID=1395960 RepID=A0A4S1XGR4_9SPHN|nr:class I SAM-dependent methyltransferase [Sphingomonas gei]TGX55147.1 methyltransferase domain-containing protein [Sphingomonas gei]
MRQTLTVLGLLTTAIAVASVAAGEPRTQRHALQDAVSAATRTPSNVARDEYRHPLETLSFFGVKPGDTVVEIWPGGGWYTEILGPLTAGKGALWAAVPLPNGVKGVQALQAKDAKAYGHVKFAAFPWSEGQPKVPDGSADVVLTFRNVHNWRMGNQEGDYSPKAFAQMFAMLKPGGVLGIEDHRLPESASAEREKSSGYIKVSTVRRLAEQAGFKFVASSEVNANPKDTTEWANGVWTLPPTYQLKDVDRAKYAAIGESDRMTLKFRKP